MIENDEQAAHTEAYIRHYTRLIEFNCQVIEWIKDGTRPGTPACFRRLDTGKVFDLEVEVNRLEIEAYTGIRDRLIGILEKYRAKR